MGGGAGSEGLDVANSRRADWGVGGRRGRRDSRPHALSTEGSRRCRKEGERHHRGSEKGEGRGRSSPPAGSERCSSRFLVFCLAHFPRQSKVARTTQQKGQKFGISIPSRSSTDPLTKKWQVGKQITNPPPKKSTADHTSSATALTRKKAQYVRTKSRFHGRRALSHPSPASLTISHLAPHAQHPHPECSKLFAYRSFTPDRWRTLQYVV